MIKVWVIYHTCRDWKLHLLALEERRNKSDLIELFKIIKGYTKCEISDFYILDNRCKGTRGHSVKLIKRRNNRDVLKFFYTRSVIKCWNQLEQHMMDQALIVLYHIYKEFEKHGWVLLWIPAKPYEPHL